ncbi:OLC1v1000710C1 [Oldenlandia corymbosa var. corymbosa]|uniref:OLC1v1000710C1 n=1 Tax=Oldenlandia corymbosa var. corymbosa TaxID=529605 RepID=A0AAV1D6J5_OLDCO|nr:OLC1v1000710C1 [Oldenlandia corymbosa var. corymbosa]
MLQSRICCFFLILMLLMVDSSEGSRRLSVETQDIEVQKLLNQLNKPPVKTIKIPDGDIIDCIHMSHQPAFDHPLLKNHTIQKIPNYHPESVFGINKTSDLETDAKLSTQGLQLFGRCPEGTIPNRRVKREDLFRASSFKGFGQKKHGSIPKPMSTSPDTQTGLQHEVAYVEGGRYYGAKAAINVWQPQIQKPNGLSLSQIWVLGGSPNSDFDSIEAGWQVSHDLYGDYNTRFFISRTVSHQIITSSIIGCDGYKETGCYNLLCSGFVQTSSQIALGAAISPISTYKSSQFQIVLLVQKDPKSGNWWLHFGGEPVGYWPAVLFSDLNNGASMVAWGGEVANSESKESTTITQMGSGCFPDEGYSGASYFRDFRVVDDSNNLIAPEDVQSFTKHSECYDVKLQKEVDWGNAIYYGGPGCP